MLDETDPLNIVSNFCVILCNKFPQILSYGENFAKELVNHQVFGTAPEYVDYVVIKRVSEKV